MKTNSVLLADDGFLLSFRSNLVRQAGSLVGPSDAEDVVQDAFVRALRSRTVRSDGDPRPWLRRITRNVAYDALRSRARHVTLEPLPVDEESAERAALRLEAGAEIGGALQTLPPAQRRTIVLHDLEGYSSAEIASLDGVAYHTVRTRLFRARHALRERLVSSPS